MSKRQGSNVFKIIICFFTFFSVSFLLSRMHKYQYLPFKKQHIRHENMFKVSNFWKYQRVGFTFCFKVVFKHVLSIFFLSLVLSNRTRHFSLTFLSPWTLQKRYKRSNFLCLFHQELFAGNVRSKFISDRVKLIEQTVSRY